MFELLKKIKPTPNSISDDKIKKTSHDVNLVDLISPGGLKIHSNHIQIGEKYARTIFIFTYPQILNTAWFSPIITLDKEMNISFFINPINTNQVVKELTKKSAQIQSQISLQLEQGKIPILNVICRLFRF